MAQKKKRTWTTNRLAGRGEMHLAAEIGRTISDAMDPSKVPSRGRQLSAEEKTALELKLNGGK